MTAYFSYAGIIRKTRTVMECLHRFCRECIDKSMRLGYEFKVSTFYIYSKKQKYETSLRGFYLGDLRNELIIESMS